MAKHIASLSGLSIGMALLFSGCGYAAEAGPAPGETLSQSYRESQSDNFQYQLVEPIQVFDNLY